MFWLLGKSEIIPQKILLKTNCYKKRPKKTAVFIHSWPSAFDLDRIQTFLVQSSWAYCVMSVAKEQRSHVVVEQAGRHLGVM